MARNYVVRVDVIPDIKLIREITEGNRCYYNRHNEFWDLKSEHRVVC